MPTHFDLNTILEIDGKVYHFAEHPAAPGMPYGQEGRAGTVYQIMGPDGPRALKVFKPRFSVPSLVSQADAMLGYASLPGLKACQRTVLTPRRQVDLLHQYPELTYAVLMPWIEGTTWQEIVQTRQAISPTQSLSLAKSLLTTLVAMEEHGLAHCDLSGPNVIINLATTGEVELVDLEGIYGPALARPEAVPSGSSGYAHKTAVQEIWSSSADRFAGAVLLAEILGWCSPEIRKLAYGESYFLPDELQQDCPRYQALVSYLEIAWGQPIARLFRDAWGSNDFKDCPTFGAWLATLPWHTLIDEQVGPPSEKPIKSRPRTEPIREAPARTTQAGTPAIIEAGVRSTGVAPFINDLNSWFDDAQAAMARQEWRKAAELLQAVILQEPDFQRQGLRAGKLLDICNKNLHPKSSTKILVLLWVLLGLALIGVAVISANPGIIGNLFTSRETPTTVESWTSVVGSDIQINTSGIENINPTDKIITTTALPTYTLLSTYTALPTYTLLPPSTNIPAEALPTYTPLATYTALPTYTILSPSLPSTTFLDNTPTPETIIQKDWKQGKVVYLVRTDLTKEERAIYTIDLANSSEPLMIFPQGKRFMGPVWSPDSSQIAFYDQFNNDLFIMPPIAGGQPTRLSTECSQPTWSPNGDQILCKAKALIFSILDAKNGALLQSLNVETGANLPDWSPINNQIAYSIEGKSILVASIPEMHSQVLINQASENYAPAWSHNGQKIAFQSNLDSNQSEIWIMDNNGLNARRVTHSGGGNWSRAPSWSPDDQWLLFVSTMAGSSGADYGELFIISVNGGDPIQISHTDGRVYDWRAHWGK